MANVWDAMKKHDAEATAETEHTDARPTPPVSKAQRKSAAPPANDKVASIAENRRIAATSENGSANFSDLLVAHHDRGSQITEEYRGLRTSLLAQAQDEKFCRLITSAMPDEGKTVTCGNLALVLTERADRRTVLIDCDLRKRTLGKLFKVPTSPGMVELLRNEVTLDDVIQPTVYPNLFFIPAGRAKLREVGELLGRAEMNEIITDLRRRYDYVIFDTPPVNIFSDTGIIGRAMGSALMVVRMNKTRKESVDKGIRLLHAANVKLDGLILTHRKYYIPNYLYRYS